MTRRRWIVTVVVIAGLCLGAEAARAQLTGPDRDEFVQSSITSCTSTVKRSNPTVPADTIKTYCTCMAGKEADMTTQADVAYMDAHKAASPEYTQRVQALAPVCKAAAGVR
jgi:hypothetical protein